MRNTKNMALLQERAAPTAAGLSTTALAAILTGVGIVLLGLLVGLVVLLIRAIRTHKRLLADLEERGVVLAQTQASQGSKRDSIAKPRAVLRRNTVLPFNKQSGWGSLPSVETINPIEPPSIPPHYAPPKPDNQSAKPSRLSWPFSPYRTSGKAIHLRKIRVPILSTVIESPKPSPLVPVLSGSQLGGDNRQPSKSQSRPSSDQSMLQYHPAFRDYRQGGDQEPVPPTRPEALRRSLTANPTSKVDTRTRPYRSNSVAEIPLSSKSEAACRPFVQRSHARSASMCSQSSGKAPDVPMPPLPLGVARIKSEAKRRSLLSRSPSRMSVSSFESAGSSILATQSSPIMSRADNGLVHKPARREWRNSVVVGPRPLRDTPTFHGAHRRLQNSPRSNPARNSVGSPSTVRQPQGDSRNSILIGSSSMQSFNFRTADNARLGREYSPTRSPLAARSSSTPRRKSGSHVTAYGSPEERRPSALRGVSGNSGALKRQISQASTQASTRSSNGNPFQWDPTPLSASKPSALKGSPSARKGHRRKNCVRISLDPTILGPQSRSPSPSAMNDIQEESPNGTTIERNSIGLGFSSTRSLPRPPSTSIFAPDLKLSATSIRASLTSSSPTLSMASYDHGPIGSPVITSQNTGLSGNKTRGVDRYSNGSLFSIPSFPSPCHGGMEPSNVVASPPPMFALSRPSDEYNSDCHLESPVIPSSPFEANLPSLPSSPERPLLDGHRPDHTLFCVQRHKNSLGDSGSSPPPPSIPIDPLILSKPAVDGADDELSDSPPCSPRTERPNPFLSSDQSTLMEPITAQEECLNTIDPAILTKDPFSTLNSTFLNTDASIASYKAANSPNTSIPSDPKSAKSLLEPLLEAAFPSSSLKAPAESRPTTEHLSVYDTPGASFNNRPTSGRGTPHSASPFSGSLVSPCSPRPGHAQLPTPALNFADIPTLNPSPSGPRGSPPRPLRSSIQKLRRMNSDAGKFGAEKQGRGERRYLRLGREDSIAIPGEESWLDELEDCEEDEESALSEERQRHLVGDLLDEWEEEATLLQCDNKPKSTSTDAVPSVPSENGQNAESEQVYSSYFTPDSRLNRSSSIWEDGERFWTSTPPPKSPPNSPNKPRNSYVPLSSSPVDTPASTKSRKRDFEVAKDDSPSESENLHKVNSNSPSERKMAGNRYRKRNVLGVSTPNVRIQVQPPTSGATGGTPGSLYDTDGFLRI